MGKESGLMNCLIFLQREKTKQVIKTFFAKGSANPPKSMPLKGTNMQNIFGNARCHGAIFPASPAKRAEVFAQGRLPFEN